MNIIFPIYLQIIIIIIILITIIILIITKNEWINSNEIYSYAANKYWKYYYLLIYNISLSKHNNKKKDILLEFI